MPLGNARTGASAFTAAGFHGNANASSTSTSTGTTGTTSDRGAREQRGKRNASATRQTAMGFENASHGATVIGRERGLPHVPHGNTALSVKADEARLNTIHDEKERKRLKRLLRNRVSAQQARERKKAYLSSLEQDETEKVSRMAELENRVTQLERENQMLRQVIQTVTRRAVPANAKDYSVPMAK